MAVRKTEPAVVIVNGTLPSQTTLQGTLDELAARVVRRAVSAPRFWSSDA